MLILEQRPGRPTLLHVPMLVRPDSTHIFQTKEEKDLMKTLRGRELKKKEAAAQLKIPPFCNGFEPSTRSSGEEGAFFCMTSPGQGISGLQTLHRARALATRLKPATDGSVQISQGGYVVLPKPFLAMFREHLGLRVPTSARQEGTLRLL
ncbi:hypothetical protein PoB_003370400 [Plakobranchus ocellatus]|uniref:Uncharacterized protein n=1 Tax=Plakobranchus ocellatus TaxID=259542 RepID=A0AAV4ALU0_9GAST|nr:hypothetical protein PoB_003370400 [Plakobranchus ocellatus]